MALLLELGVLRSPSCARGPGETGEPFKLRHMWEWGMAALAGDLENGYGLEKPRPGSLLGVKGLRVREERAKIKNSVRCACYKTSHATHY